jgi:hypothetical protein
VRQNTVRGRALVWLLGALALALVCARMSLAMILPWL